MTPDSKQQPTHIREVSVVPPEDNDDDDADEQDTHERLAFETRDMLYALAGRQPIPADDLYRDGSHTGGWVIVSYLFPCCVGWIVLALFISRLQFAFAAFVAAAMVMSYGAGQIREKIFYQRRSQVTVVSLEDNIARLSELRDVAFAPDVVHAYIYFQERDPLIAAAVIRVLDRVKASDRHLFDDVSQANLRDIVIKSKVVQVRLAALEALYQVGDHEAYKAVDTIVAWPVSRENPQSLRSRAMQILPELQVRANEAEKTNRLLRPAKTGEEKLLRPAGHAETDQEQLLRPTNELPGENDHPGN